MAWNINRVVLVGRLSSDVELKYTPSGAAVAKFGLAVGGKPRQDGSDSVSFFNIEVWGKSAENASAYLAKGRQVVIDGRLEQRSWTAQDGSRRSTVNIVAERVEFIGGHGQNGHGQQNGAYTEPAADPTGDDVFYDNTGFDPTPVDPSEPSF